MVTQNTVKLAKVRETRAMRDLETKKIEIDMKASNAEVNREREIQRRIQAIRQQVIHSNIPMIGSACHFVRFLSFVYLMFLVKK